jgi:hypothetical protein
VGEDRPDFQPRQDISVESGKNVEVFTEVRDSGLDTGDTELVEFAPPAGFTLTLADLSFDVLAPPGTGGHGLLITAGGGFAGRLASADSTSSAGLEFNFGRWTEADDGADPPTSTDPLAYQRIQGQEIQQNEPLQFFYTNRSSLETFRQRTYSAYGVRRQIDPDA